MSDTVSCSASEPLINPSVPLINPSIPGNTSVCEELTQLIHYPRGTEETFFKIL